MKNTFLRTGLLLACLHPFFSHADSLPKWELGVGLGALSVPDYRGSDQRSGYLFPTPYFVYRGDVIRADRSGMRAALFESDRLEINLSLNATLPGRDNDNSLRRGMEDLRPTMEVGPTADFRLWAASDDRLRMSFRLPVRAAYTVESSPRHIGWLFSPNLLLQLRDPAGMGGWKLGLQGGPVYATRDYNGYLYSVSAADAIAGRPAYAAGSGYAGMQATATLSKRFRHYWLGAFLRYDHLGGAVFADSPLVQRNNALTAGLAFAWVFGTSSQRVDADE
ncbi:MipA/OmpV family protein [Noviherbaspirillum saxi]|uniref:MipA/OmpV family protein n=1 Tax=Noviherbaspirillum saxi TaxID=2320863 RepID=A0A3A3FTC8_9BURK|nr:MipA/OmpV family protein [Noviherbaspirillum saxi]RJF99306.1 MipA/OmpV family protein [Noviherbaspirillum saxi]